MYRLISLLLLTTLLALHAPTALADPMDAPRISLITCMPSDAAQYQMYGHTAIRVVQGQEDYVFNYGQFSFDQPHFYLNFALGKPLYRLGVYSFGDFLLEYSAYGRDVWEQELNLDPDQAQALYAALIDNARPDKCDYLYNYFFDNCATRPRDLIEKYIGGIQYPARSEAETFRHAIRDLTATDRWYTFGCDLCLGLRSDLPMTVRESHFLPLNLFRDFSEATRLRDGAPVVHETHKLLAETHKNRTRDPRSLTPHRAAAFLLALWCCLYALARVSRYRVALKVYRTALYLAVGLGGVVLWFLGLVSAHPHTFPNLNMLPLNPLYLFLAASLWCRRADRVNNWLYFINFVSLIAYMALTALPIRLQTPPEGMLTIAVLLALDIAQRGASVVKGTDRTSKKGDRER